MMIKAKGPVWHQKQRKQGIIPKGLTGLDKEASWSYSKADSWVYGHGSFCITTHQTNVLGGFKWMPNSAHEGKRLLAEIIKFKKHVRTVCMDSKADDQGLYFKLKEDHDIGLITPPRKGKAKTQKRKQMQKEMWTKENRKIYQHRATTVEPMQALVKDIFSLEHCWMRGDASNRWLFAAMGVAVQIAQNLAYKADCSTWQVKHLVLGR